MVSCNGGHVIGERLIVRVTPPLAGDPHGTPDTTPGRSLPSRHLTRASGSGMFGNNGTENRLAQFMVVDLQRAETDDGRVRRHGWTVNAPVIVPPPGSPGLVEPSSQAEGHTQPAQLHAHQAPPPLTAPVVVATAAPGTTPPLSGPRHGPSTPRPWPVYQAASVSLHPSQWAARAAARPGVNWREASQRDRPCGRGPAVGGNPPRLCSGS